MTRFAYRHIALAAGLTVATSLATAQTVVKIGHVGPTTGGIAHLGKDNEMGARMAIDELNAAGVTIGQQKVTLELMAEDDGADPKQGTAVAQKLVDGVRSRLVTGLNLPMLLRALSYREDSLDALVARTLAGASQGVMQVAATAPQNQNRRSHDQDQRDHQQ